MATVFVRGRSRQERTPESAWRSVGMRWLRERFGRYLWEYRTVGGIGQRNGVPDDLLLIRYRPLGQSEDASELTQGMPQGCFVAIEWKKPTYTGGKRATAQDAEIEWIIRCGGRAGKVRNMQELEKLVEGIPVVQSSIKYH